MKSIYKFQVFSNKITRIFLLIASLSIFLWLFGFHAEAQWNSLSYPLINPQPELPGWQNYNPIPYAFGFPNMYAGYSNFSLNQSLPFTRMIPGQSPNFMNYSPYMGFGIQNYQYSGLGNVTLFSPLVYQASFSPTQTMNFNTPGSFYPAMSQFFSGYHFYNPLYMTPYILPYSQPTKPSQTYPPSTKAVDYLAVLPEALLIGAQETVSVSLFSREGLTRGRATGRVRVVLEKDGEKILEAQNYIYDKGTIKFNVPEVEAGSYKLRIKGEDFEDSANVNVLEDLLIFIQTDKPIYQPEQTIHMRVITLNSELKPKSREVVIEVLDAKGIKIFRKGVISDTYGLATLDLPISREPNLGVWKITATASNQVNTQLDVKVERYVLPKYEVKTELPKEWFLVNEPIVGKVKAEYSFGKPVKGELVIEASKYVGQWEDYEIFNTEIDGEAEFEISPAGYVAGVPGSGGMGNVQLDIKVKEIHTGYEEQINQLITISSSPLSLQIIPESSVFKPSLPFNALIITETPDRKPTDAMVSVEINYVNHQLQQMEKDELVVETQGGKALFTFTPPEGCIALVIQAEAEEALATKALESGHSPSGNFIHVEQISQGIPNVGEKIRFKIHSTHEAVHFYYEVIARGRVVSSDFTQSREIAITAIPMMAPQSRFLVYQILPNSEVAADYLPFDVEANYPHMVKVELSAEEVKPGQEVSINIQTEGKAKVGLAAVDRSVFILAEKRLNLQQVFEEIERLYMKPQAELHDSSVYYQVNTKGAQEIFKNAGVIVLTNKTIPKGKEYKFGGWGWPALGDPDGIENFFFADGAVPKDASAPSATEELATVDKIRQFFPETWLWQDVLTNTQGYASIKVTAPDTITTWMLHAVGISKEKGLGIYEEDLRAFQPFFIKIDLPYSAIRGEEFPVNVSIYNYLDEVQDVQVEIEEQEWFILLENGQKVVSVGANDIGGVRFNIKPQELGLQEIKIIARSSSVADAVIKNIMIIPEGIEKDDVQNFVLNAGDSRTVSTSIPSNVVEGSGRSYIAATSSYLSQTIEGLDELLKMPFGCGEQNMIFLAPDIYITRYLRETGQLKPEIMAKAEKLMITGYQREMTYRRNDGSFSAFGKSDQEGSLWLTAFVLKVFSQARELMYIDEYVLNEAKNWLVNHQNPNGSFDPVGFLHHKEMMGGLEGKTALTAFTAIALGEAGAGNSLASAVAYLQAHLYEIKDAYTMAIAAYALELADSSLTGDAYDKLIDFADVDENGLFWPANGAEIEATAYAMLALMEHGDTFNAGRAAKWIVSKRNPFGGYQSTQDTVIALEALTRFSRDVTSDADLTLQIKTGTGINKQIHIGNSNYDILQIIEVPVNEEVQIIAEGEGEAVIQLVKRFNLPTPPATGQTFLISVDYDTTEVEVNDLVTVLVDIGFNPPMPVEAGMVVLDISIPTGFTAVTESLEDVLTAKAKIKRYEIAGRKVIFYIENMLPGESISFNFKVKAMYPVKAKGTASTVYSYYTPEMMGETIGKDMVVF